MLNKKFAIVSRNNALLKHIDKIAGLLQDTGIHDGSRGFSEELVLLVVPMPDLIVSHLNTFQRVFPHQPRIELRDRLIFFLVKMHCHNGLTICVASAQ